MTPRIADDHTTRIADALCNALRRLRVRKATQGSLGSRRRLVVMDAHQISNVISFDASFDQGPDLERLFSPAAPGDAPVSLLGSACGPLAVQ